jgi:hypothetical protein
LEADAPALPASHFGAAITKGIPEATQRSMATVRELTRPTGTGTKLGEQDRESKGDPVKHAGGGVVGRRDVMSKKAFNFDFVSR